MATSTPQDDFMKTALRLPRELHARLMASAVEKGRSLNSELIARLEESYERATTEREEAILRELRRTQYRFELHAARAELAQLRHRHRETAEAIEELGRANLPDEGMKKLTAELNAILREKKAIEVREVLAASKLDELERAEANARP
jgi:hypothetical protein